MHAVGIILENQNGEILILKRRPEILEGGKWGVAGGGVHIGEEPLQSALRNAYEETGQKISEDNIKFIKTFKWNLPYGETSFDLFRCKVNDYPDILMDINEHTEATWIKPEEAVKRIDLMQGMYPILKEVYKVKKAI